MGLLAEEEQMVILGIDGSLRATGLALLDGTAVRIELAILTTPEKKQRRIYAADDDGRRIDEIAQAIDDLAIAADLVAIEAPAGSQSSSGAKALGLAYGAARAVCVVRRKPVIVVQAQEAKRLACGSRDASKGAVVQWATTWAGPIAASTKPAREAIADARALVHAAMRAPHVRAA